VCDLQPLFGNNDKGLERRVWRGMLPLARDEGAILFRVHFETTPAQGGADSLPNERCVFANSAVRSWSAANYFLFLMLMGPLRLRME
jgi:hypothetical protein